MADADAAKYMDVLAVHTAGLEFPTPYDCFLVVCAVIKATFLLLPPRIHSITATTASTKTTAHVTMRGSGTTWSLHSRAPSLVGRSG